MASAPAPEIPHRPAFVYVLRSVGETRRRTYVGWTVDLEARLKAHNGGTGAKSTRGHAWELLYAERHPTRADAMRREWFLKRDRKFRKAIADAGPVTPPPPAF